MPAFIFSTLLALLIAIVVIVTLLRSVRVIRQQQVAVVERLGKFRRTLEPVSYTHLDVYKRQGSWWPRGNTPPGPPSSTGNALDVRRYPATDWYARW